MKCVVLDELNVDDIFGWKVRFLMLGIRLRIKKIDSCV